MGSKEHQIWFDILMYTILLICITYLIDLNQMQKHFIYIVVAAYILAISSKVIALTQLKHNDAKKE